MGVVKPIEFEEFSKHNPDVPQDGMSKYFFIEKLRCYATVSPDNEVEFYGFEEVELSEEEEFDLLSALTSNVNLRKDREFLDKEYEDELVKNSGLADGEDLFAMKHSTREEDKIKKVSKVVKVVTLAVLVLTVVVAGLLING